MAARAGTSESVVLRIALAEGLQAMAPWNVFYALDQWVVFRDKIYREPWVFPIQFPYKTEKNHGFSYLWDVMWWFSYKSSLTLMIGWGFDMISPKKMGFKSSIGWNFLGRYGFFKALNGKMEGFKHDKRGISIGIWMRYITNNTQVGVMENGRSKDTTPPTIFIVINRDITILDMFWLCLKVGTTTQCMAISWKGKEKPLGSKTTQDIITLPLVALNWSIKQKLGPNCREFYLHNRWYS